MLLRKGCCALLVPLALLALGGPARADLIFTASGSIANEGAVNARATFIAENGDNKIVLQNLGPTNSMGAAQAISEFFFSVDGLTLRASDLKLTSLSGPTINYGSPTTTSSASATGSGAPLLHWGFGGLGGNALELATVQRNGNDNVAPGGSPMYMIMSQNATPRGNVSNFDPYFNGSATYIISDSHVTSATTLNISSVKFGFGTGPELTLPGVPGVPSPVPEPSTMALALTGLAALCFGSVRRFRARVAVAGRAN
jgi:hypothetical protein